MSRKNLVGGMVTFLLDTFWDVGMFSSRVRNETEEYAEVWIRWGEENGKNWEIDIKVKRFQGGVGLELTSTGGKEDVSRAYSIIQKAARRKLARIASQN